MRIRKIAAIIIIMAFAFQGVALGRPQPTSLVKQEVFSEAPGFPDIKAKGAVLIDFNSGQVLYGLNPHTPLPPASTTKILTGIIALEKAKLNDIVTVSESVNRVDGTHIGLKPGEKLTMKDLLYALLLNSSNDAAVVIAEHISGTTDKFSKLMNDRAKELGAKDSNFVNPNGLPNAKHNTSAYDLALITRYAMKNSTFREIVATPSYNITREIKGAQTSLYNHNKLIQPGSIYKYPSAIGVKTGYTIQARQCIVAAAKRDNREYIAVVLGAESIWLMPRLLLDYGFNNFHSVDVILPGEFVQNVPAKYGNDKVNLVSKSGFSVSLPNNENKLPERKIILNEVIKAPIKEGQRMGRVDYYYQGKKIGSVELVAQHKVGRKITSHKSLWGTAGIVSGLILLILYLAYKYRLYKKRHRKLRKMNKVWYDNDFDIK